MKRDYTPRCAVCRGPYTPDYRRDDGDDSDDPEAESDDD